MLNYTWIDDGVYPIQITVEDENDETVMILNVPCKTEIRRLRWSQRTEAKVVPHYALCLRQRF